MRSRHSVQLCVATALFCGLASAQTVLRTFAPYYTWDQIRVIGDIDGDGLRDFVFMRHSSTLWPGIGNVDVVSSRMGGTLLQIPPSAAVLTVSVFRAGDHDGDGRDDIGVWEARLVGGSWTSAVVVRSGVNGAYLFQGPTANATPVGGVDIDQDGIPDVLVSDPGYSVGGMTQVGRVDAISGATGQVIRSHVGLVTNQALAAFARVGDLDADGADDYVLGSAGLYSPNPSFRFFSTRSGAPLAVVPKTSGTYGLGLANIGDFNADGYADIILRDQGSAPLFGVYAVSVLGGPGLSQTQLLWSQYWLQQVPGPEYYTLNAGYIGDLDGDGHCDIALRGGIAPAVSTVLSGRNQAVLHAFPHFANFSSIFDVDSPGDVNADGFPDLVFRGSGPTATTAVISIVSGAPPGVSLLGTACADQTGRQPRIGVGVGARLGSTMTVNLSNANPALLSATLALGFSATVWGGTPLPLDLTPFGLPGCNWQVAPDAVLTLPTVGVNGTRHHATYELAVPQQSSLLGLDLFAQWLVVEPSAYGLTGSTTRAARMTVVP
jgi:hypothetical protein